MNTDRDAAETSAAQGVHQGAQGQASSTGRGRPSLTNKLKALRESGRQHRFGPEVLPVSLSAPFIRRPVATALLTFAIALAGIVAFGLLPVAPLPQVDFPVVVVRAKLPGAGPETMAATVATPLERSLGRIAGVTEMTSTSSLSSTEIVLQFDLDRNIDGAARDVQSSINAARSKPAHHARQPHLPQD